MENSKLPKGMQRPPPQKPTIFPSIGQTGLGQNDLERLNQASYESAQAQLIPCLHKSHIIYLYVSYIFICKLLKIIKVLNVAALFFMTDCLFTKEAVKKVPIVPRCHQVNSWFFFNFVFSFN